MPQYHLPKPPRLNGPREFNWAGGVNGVNFGVIDINFTGHSGADWNEPTGGSVPRNKRRTHIE